MKKILYVLNSGKWGGMEQHTLDLVRGVLKYGHQVWVICPDGEMVKRYEEAGGTVIIDRIRFDIDPFFIRRLVKFIRRENVDVIHGHELKAGLNALIAGKIAKTPLKIIHIHTPISQWQISPLKKRINLFVNKVLSNKLADKVIALSEEVKKEKEEKEGIDENKIVVIPNGIDAALFTPPNSDAPALHNPFTVGYLARMTVEKGHEFLLRGFENFLHQYFRGQPLDEWPILMLGGIGQLEESLKGQAKELGISQFVHFVGFVPEERKLEFYRSLDVFVFPTLAEGFGLVLIEAMACGLPCLASDLPVLKEVGGDAIVTFESGQPSDLAEKLYNLYLRQDIRESLSKRGQERVKNNFTLEKFWDNYNNLYTL